jgi:hypothetical protein
MRGSTSHSRSAPLTRILTGMFTGGAHSVPSPILAGPTSCCQRKEMEVQDSRYALMRLENALIGPRSCDRKMYEGVPEGYAAVDSRQRIKVMVKA